MRNKPIKTQCMVCGKEIITHISRIKSGRGKYCSNTCKNDRNEKNSKRHSHTINGRHRFEYQLIVEKVLNRKLKSGEVVHHIDGNTKNNSNNNLIVCTQGYHLFIHARKDAFNSTGNAKYRKCVYCKRWSDTGNMVFHNKNKNTWRHSGCYFRKAA